MRENAYDAHLDSDHEPSENARRNHVEDREHREAEAEEGLAEREEYSYQRYLETERARQGKYETSVPDRLDAGGAATYYLTLPGSVWTDERRRPLVKLAMRAQRLVKLYAVRAPDNILRQEIALIEATLRELRACLAFEPAEVLLGDNVGCVGCGAWVDVAAGFDTCPACAAKS